MRLRRPRSRIAMVRVLLSASAAGLLGSLVIYPNLFSGIGAQNSGKDKLAAGHGVEQATYAGVTADGSTISVASDAASASNPGNEPTSAKSIKVLLETAYGESYQVDAPVASIDPASKIATISGGAVLTADGGFVVESGGFSFSLERTQMHSLGEVEFTFPGGSGRAGSLSLSPGENAPAGSVPDQLEFSGDVVVVYNFPGK